MIIEDNSTITEEDIRDYAHKKIARYKVPKHIFIVDGFPMTASGKIQKFKLREQAVDILKREQIEEEKI